MKNIKYILIILASSILFLKAEEPQKILVEQYTTSHPNSPNLVPLSQQFNNIVNSNSEIIPFTIHTNFNTNKIHDQNSELSKRVIYYRGNYTDYPVPIFYVNGIEVEDISNLESTINSEKNKATPLKINVQEDRSGQNAISINIKIESDTEFSSKYRVFGMLIEGHISDNSIGHPSENDFYDVGRAMRLNWGQGEVMDINKFGFSGHRYTFQIEDFWNANELYAIAWVQNSDTRRVHQVAKVKVFNENPEIVSEMDTVKFNDENQNETLFLNLYNSKMSNLDLESISLESDEHFSIQYVPNQNRVYPGQSKEISISFDANEVGEYSTNLIVESNAANEPTLKIPIVANITQTSFAEITLSTETIDFGDVDTYAFDTLYVSNTGSGDLSISTVYFDDDYDGDFEILNTNFPDIKPGEDWEVVLKFQPSEEQTYFSLLNIESNANNDAVKSIQVEGNGVDLTPHATSLLSAESIIFGETGVEAKTRSLVITNIGNQELQVQNSQIEDDPDGVFSFVGEPILNIPGGEKDSLVIQFQPSAEKEYNATLVVRTNDTDASKRRNEVALSGIGTDITSVENKEILDNYFDLNVYPNPATDEIKLDFGDFAGSVNLRISNLRGILLQSLELNISNNSTKSIKLNELNTGSYIMEISDGNKSTSLKFNVVK